MTISHCLHLILSALLTQILTCPLRRMVWLYLELVLALLFILQVPLRHPLLEMY